MGDEQKCSKKRKKMHLTIQKRGCKKMHGSEIVFEYSCLQYFFPHSKLKKSQRTWNKKTLIISNVLENKKKCERRAKIQWCGSGFYHHVTLKFWLRKNITVLKIYLSMTNERVGGYVCSRDARSIPGENIHSSMKLLTALLTLSFLYLFFFSTINV